MSLSAQEFLKYASMFGLTPDGGGSGGYVGFGISVQTGNFTVNPLDNNTIYVVKPASDVQVIVSFESAASYPPGFTCGIVQDYNSAAQEVLLVPPSPSTINFNKSMGLGRSQGVFLTLDSSSNWASIVSTGGGPALPLNVGVNHAYTFQAKDNAAFVYFPADGEARALTLPDNTDLDVESFWAVVHNPGSLDVTIVSSDTIEGETTIPAGSAAMIYKRVYGVPNTWSVLAFNGTVEPIGLNYLTNNGVDTVIINDGDGFTMAPPVAIFYKFTNANNAFDIILPALDTSGLKQGDEIIAWNATSHDAILKTGGTGDPIVTIPSGTAATIRIMHIATANGEVAVFLSNGTDEVYLIADNNLSDVPNAASARSNIGLGTDANVTFSSLTTEFSQIVVDDPADALVQRFRNAGAGGTYADYLGTTSTAAIAEFARVTALMTDNTDGAVSSQIQWLMYLAGAPSNAMTLRGDGLHDTALYFADPAKLLATQETLGIGPTSDPIFNSVHVVKAAVADDPFIVLTNTGSGFNEIESTWEANNSSDDPVVAVKSGVSLTSLTPAAETGQYIIDVIKNGTLVEALNLTADGLKNTALNYTDPNKILTTRTQLGLGPSNTPSFWGLTLAGESPDMSFNSTLDSSFPLNQTFRFVDGASILYDAVTIGVVSAMANKDVRVVYNISTESGIVPNAVIFTGDGIVDTVLVYNNTTKRDQTKTNLGLGTAADKDTTDDTKSEVVALGGTPVADNLVAFDANGSAVDSGLSKNGNNLTVETVVDGYTIAADDLNRVLFNAGASLVTINVPANAAVSIGAGWHVDITCNNTAGMTLAFDAGDTVVGSPILGYGVSARLLKTVSSLPSGASTWQIDQTADSNNVAYESLISIAADIQNISTGYAIGDTITLDGGVYTEQASCTVTELQLATYNINTGGSAYAVGDFVTFQGGTGTNPVGYVTAVSFGEVIGFSFDPNAHPGTTRGSMTAVPATFTQASTTGGGTGVTINTLTFGVAAASVLVPGQYTEVPANPVLQDTTSGSGTGAEFTATWGNGLFNVQLTYTDPVILARSQESLEITGLQELPDLKLVVPNTNGAPFDLREFTNASFLANVFNDTSISYVELHGKMPIRWDGTALTFQLDFETTATSGNFVIRVDAALINVGGSYNVTFGTAQSSTGAAGSASTRITLNPAAVTPSGTYTNDTSPIVIYRIYRDPTDGADTLVGNVNLINFSYRYVADQGNDA